jgi:hypothetical protein
MRAWRLASLGLIFFGCGGATEDFGAQSTGGSTSFGGFSGTGGLWNPGTGGTSTGGRNYSTYTATGCPDAASPPVIAQCDLFASVSGCPTGQACYPTIRATSDPCQPEQYYYVCARAGTGTQWSNCSSSNDCAQGYVCVVATAGTKCQETCSLSNPSTCPPGMFCDPIDVAGVGTCS